MLVGGANELQRLIDGGELARMLARTSPSKPS
jgi:hypothetical protein